MAKFAHINMVKGAQAKPEFKLRPTKVQVDAQYKNWEFIFDVSTYVQPHEQRKDRDNYVGIFEILTERLLSKQRTQFQQSKHFNGHTILEFPQEKTDEQQREEKDSTLHNQIKKKEREERAKRKGVECICVNGECDPKTGKCRSCKAGWRGDLCDIRSNSKNVNKPLSTQGRVYIDKGNSNNKRPASVEDDSPTWFASRVVDRYRS